MNDASMDDGDPANSRTTDRERRRPLNTRPRDALGRPLPYGSTGFVGPPTGVRRSPAETLAEARRLLAAGLPFHAHEVLEDAWRAAPAAERELWRGLAQLAVGCTHAARGNLVGARALLRRGAAAISAYRSLAPHGLTIDALLRWVDGVLADRRAEEADADSTAMLSGFAALLDTTGTR